MKPIWILTFFLIMNGTLLAQSKVNNTSYITPGGEKVLRLEAILPVDIKAAWSYFTTDENIKKWMAPVAHVELRTGGYIRTNYDAKKSLDDPSSIQLGIINYLPNELLTLKVKLNGTFPSKAQATDQNLQEIIQFEDAGDGHTKVISSMVGWGTGPEWDETYKFFDRGNTWTFQELLKLFP
jgi:uncharacterized protein YndB with AHSA1/START domain